MYIKADLCRTLAKKSDRDFFLLRKNSEYKVNVKKSDKKYRNFNTYMENAR